MNNIITVLNIVAPVFLLAAFGYAWVRLGFEYRVQFITRLTMNLALPCLIFTALMNSQVEPAALAAVSLASLVAYAIVSIVIFALVAVMRLDRRTYAAPLIFGNTGNLGLPLALFAFGDVGLEYAVVIFAVMMILSFTVGIWVVAGGGGATRLFREPSVFAVLLGALFLWQDWTTPVFLTNTLQLAGQMLIPLMLITLGVALARLEARAMGRAVLLAAIKVVVCIGAGVLAAQWFALEPVAAAVLVLQVATPVAVTSYLIAEKYGADAQSVAGLVVASTLMSVVTLPLILSFVI